MGGQAHKSPAPRGGAGATPTSPSCTAIRGPPITWPGRSSGSGLTATRHGKILGTPSPSHSPRIRLHLGDRSAARRRIRAHRKAGGPGPAVDTPGPVSGRGSGASGAIAVHALAAYGSPRRPRVRPGPRTSKAHAVTASKRAAPRGRRGRRSDPSPKRERSLIHFRHARRGVLAPGTCLLG